MGISGNYGTGERNEQNSSIPIPRFEGVQSPLYHAGGTCSHIGVMDYPRYPISEVHLGKFADSLKIESWKVNFKTEECAKSAFLHITMHWIQDVEIAKSIGDLMTSQSITSRRDFTDHDILDAMIASALKKLLTSVHSRKRVRVAKQRAQKDDRFLRGGKLLT